MPQIANFLPGMCNLALILHFKRSCCLGLFLGGRLYVSVYVFLKASAKGSLPPVRFAAQRALLQPIQPVRSKRSAAALSSARKLFPLCRLLAAFDECLSVEHRPY